MDIREVIRQVRSGRSDRAIHRDTGIHRDTLRKYREWAATQGLLEGELPPVDIIHQQLEESMPSAPPPQQVSSVEPYREAVEKMWREGVAMTAIHARLRERGYKGSYGAVRRFIHRLDPRTPEATVRVETKPGEEAQVDFGYAGKMIDPASGKLCRAWAFVMTLSWSRHQYVEFVFDQKVETWLACHRHAFEYFGGVPQRIVLDNLKAAIVRASVEDPQVQQAYRECAEHYGFLISPCRPRTPQHKGKVERGVDYVKRNFLGGREPTVITQANREVRMWCKTTAGERIHGTTKEQPLMRFQETEQARLQPLPPYPYDPGVWKLLKLHRDCHVVFDGAYYSAPFAYIGQQLRVWGNARQVRIYTADHQLVAMHERAAKAGTRQTHLNHLPAEKIPGLVMNRDVCQTQAALTGKAVGQLVRYLLDDTVVDRLPTVRRLLQLREVYGDDRLEAACERALRFGDPSYPTVKRILTLGLDAADTPDPVPTPPARTFVRTAVELVGQVLGGLSWN